MSKYLVDITPEDIGEILQMIRIQHFKMHVDPFAEKIGVKPKVVIQVEEGRGPHGLLLLKKISDTFPSVSVSLEVEFK
jgi:DNA-binding XRE family transcriptional regulator